MKNKPTRREFLRIGSISAAGLLAACAGLPVAKPTKPHPPAQPQPVEVPLPGNKRIRIAFQFSGHETEEEAREIEPLLEEFKPHVVGLESGGGSEEEARSIEDDYSNSQYMQFSEHVTAVMNILKAHSIPRIFIMERAATPQEREQFIEKAKGFNEKTYRTLELFLQGRHQEAIENHRELIIEFAEENKKREKNIKGVLSNFYAELVKRYPELEKEKEIRVVVKYGTMHTPLYHHARRVGFAATKMNMLRPSYNIPLHVQVHRMMFNLPPKHSDEEIARTVVGDILASYSLIIGANHSNSAAFANLLSRKVALEQARRISDRLSEYPKNTIGQINAAVQNAFTREGFPLPGSKTEVHTWLREGESHSHLFKSALPLSLP